MDCKACGKKFVNKYSLARHHERMPLCLQWIESKLSTESTIQEQPIEESICNLPTRLRERVETIISLPGTTTPTCKYCSHTFTRMSSLHDHYSSSLMCNKYALEELEKQLPGICGLLAVT